MTLIITLIKILMILLTIIIVIIIDGIITTISRTARIITGRMKMAVQTMKTLIIKTIMKMCVTVR